MTPYFRIAVLDQNGPAPVAVITARRLSAFRRYLSAESIRLGHALVAPDDMLADHFEARVCPLALAAMTAIFVQDPAVISVIEEAQFRGCRITVEHCADVAEITMRVAAISDDGLALVLPEAEASALREALGLAPDGAGDIALDQLGRRLADPVTHARAARLGAAHHVALLVHLLARAPTMAHACLAGA